jgi:hypothetical protein
MSEIMVIIIPTCFAIIFYINFITLSGPFQGMWNRDMLPYFVTAIPLITHYKYTLFVFF